MRIRCYICRNVCNKTLCSAEENILTREARTSVSHLDNFCGLVVNMCSSSNTSVVVFLCRTCKLVAQVDVILPDDNIDNFVLF